MIGTKFFFNILIKKDYEKTIKSTQDSENRKIFKGFNIVYTERFEIFCF